MDPTQQVLISPKGDARIHDTSLSVPSTCSSLAPVVLVHPNGLGTIHSALDGWRLQGRSEKHSDRPPLNVVALPTAS